MSDPTPNADCAKVHATEMNELRHSMVRPARIPDLQLGERYP